jgi:hypothetical protein
VIDMLSSSASILSEAGFSTQRASVAGREAIVFENNTTLGFVLFYDEAAELLHASSRDGEHLIKHHQFGLRRAGQKAWNTYMVFLTGGSVDHSQLAALAAIEEDLGGTRKIARADIRDPLDVREALLALLPIQAAPALDAVDMLAEIRERASEVAPRAIDAFLSTAAEDAVVLQVLEEEP